MVDEIREMVEEVGEREDRWVEGERDGKVTEQDLPVISTEESMIENCQNSHQDVNGFARAFVKNSSLPNMSDFRRFSQNFDIVNRIFGQRDEISIICIPELSALRSLRP